jgi:hypothetical protein
MRKKPRVLAEPVGTGAKMTPGLKSVSLRLDPDVQRRLKVYAATRGVSMALALGEVLDENLPELGP